MNSTQFFDPFGRPLPPSATLGSSLGVPSPGECTGSSANWHYSLSRDPTMQHWLGIARWVGIVFTIVFSLATAVFSIIATTIAITWALSAVYHGGRQGFVKLQNHVENVQSDVAETKTILRTALTAETNLLLAVQAKLLGAQMVIQQQDAIIEEREKQMERLGAQVTNLTVELESERSKRMFAKSEVTQTANEVGRIVQHLDPESAETLETQKGRVGKTWSHLKDAGNSILGKPSHEDKSRAALARQLAPNVVRLERLFSTSNSEQAQSSAAQVYRMPIRVVPASMTYRGIDLSPKRIRADEDQRIVRLP